jgi:hypothetical protein
MSRAEIVNSTNLNHSETAASKILQAVPFDQGFHFCTENGVYLEVTAVSLADFAEKLLKVKTDSILFHYSRGDFQAWIKTTLGDERLALRISKMQSDLSPGNLRKQLVSLVNKRVLELSRISRHKLAGLYVEE